MQIHSPSHKQETHLYKAKSITQLDSLLCLIAIYATEPTQKPIKIRLIFELLLLPKGAPP